MKKAMDYSSASDFNAEFEILEDLNSLTYKPALPMKEMKIKHLYKILGCRRLQTKFGPKIVLDLVDNQLFLPHRFNNMSERAFDSINDGGYIITNRGPIGRSFDLIFTKTKNMGFYKSI